ncbi:MAG: GNAT family N-acetyltransferase [Anaerolineae bacterium]|nr:GNAT family N-acetyltransferase [Anaerolineae bacterium]
MPGYQTRVASGDDEEVALDALRRAHRVVIRTDPEHDDSSTADLLRRCTLFLVEEDAAVAGVCAAAIEPPTIAQIVAFAARDHWRERDVLRALLPTARCVLGEAGVGTLAYIGIERWLLDALAAAGFVHTDTVITLQKDRFDIPHPGNRRVHVRPAREQDLDAILAIDELAFEPLWRNTRRTLRTCLARMPYVGVAEFEGTIAGYVALSLVGRHGHVTRIAVHPCFQGQGIAIRLLAEGIAFFEKRRAFAITLNTQLDNARAQRLYAWFGFHLLGDEAHVMRLDLRSHGDAGH